MAHLRMQVKRVGPHFRTVLVGGEAGSGKLLVARELHRLSAGADGPFVVCDAREDLASWRVSRDRAATAAELIQGVVTKAQGGTLFLGDISGMPPEIQTELLRFLRRQESQRSERMCIQRMNVRLVASSREDLKVLASAGRFSLELYQRLVAVEMIVPPLRERKEDLPELAMCLVARLTKMHDRQIERIAVDATERLCAHEWPGNVRELEDVLQQGVLRCEGAVLESHHLPVFTAGSGSEGSEERFVVKLQDVMNEHVLRVLKRCAGNKLRAAELLGISRSTLYRMLDGLNSVDSTAISHRMTRGERYTG